MPIYPYLAVPGDCPALTAGAATLYDCGPGDLRRACGKTLYGPLLVLSQAPFSLSIREPAPVPGRRGFVTVADGCGRQMTMPQSGQEFFIALPPNAPSSEYELTLTAGESDVASVRIAIAAPRPGAQPQPPGPSKGPKLRKGYR